MSGEIFSLFILCSVDLLLRFFITTDVICTSTTAACLGKEKDGTGGTFLNPCYNSKKEILCLLFGISTLQYHSNISWCSCLVTKPVLLYLLLKLFMWSLVQLDAFLLLINRVNSGLATNHGNKR